MGKLLTNKTSKKAVNSSNSSNPSTVKIELYKPISDFAWKDAPRAEIHQNSIKAYKKFAF